MESRPRLPVLAVVLDSPSLEFFPLTYLEAVRGVCSPLWVTLRDDPETARYLRILRRAGAVAEVAGMTPAQAASAIGAHAPSGIITFNEANVPWTAEVAELLQLRYHSRRTAAQLADKLEQRTALREHGLLTPQFWSLDELRGDRRQLDDVAEGATFPLVLKPRTGRSSSDIARLDTPENLREVAATDHPNAMLVEEFIPDPSSSATGTGNAHYVSVEVLGSRGTFSVLGATGRHPLVEPFREAGLFFPAEVSAELYERLVETSRSALRALDIEDGAFHVEFKVTDAGPVVIEINPRPGGSALPDLLQHALGINVFQAAMRIAVGESVIYDDLPRATDVGFSVYVLPPSELVHITSVEGIDGLSSIEGVESVVPKRGAGDDIDPHGGMMEYIVRVSGTAPDHPTRRRIREEVLSRVVVDGRP